MPKVSEICFKLGEHQFNYDASLSSVTESVFSCVCGETQQENEDAGTGA